MRQPFPFTTLLSVFFASSLSSKKKKLAVSVGLKKLTSRTMMARLEKIESMSSLVRTQASSFVVNHNLETMEVILWDDDDDGDHVPELGVMSVHEQCSTSPGRYQNQDTCQQGLLCLTA